MHDEPFIFKLSKGARSNLGATGVTPGGLRYVYFVDNLPSDSAIGIFAVSLPFQTNTHVLGIPAAQKDALNVSSESDYEPVVLEGDFQTYFSTYARKDQQMESRVILNPEAMQHAIEFCSTHIWELVNNTLYFANTGRLPEPAIIDSFVEQITPANATAAAMRLIEKVQKQEKLSQIDSKFLCPVCKLALREGRHWLACRDGHGYYIRNNQIQETRAHIHDFARTVKASIGARPNVITPLTQVDHGDLICPNDNIPMTKKPYQETTASLYVCGSCVYRWIDAQDLDTILGPYRNDGDDEVEKEEDSNWLSDISGSLTRNVNIDHMNLF